MSVELVVGPVGVGKTSRALAEFKQYSPSEHRVGIRFLVPSVSHTLYLRQQLLSDAQFPGLLGDPIRTIDEFTKEVLASAKRANIQVVTELQALEILKASLMGTSKDCFASIEDRQVLIESLRRVFRELKSVGISSDELTNALIAAKRRLPEPSRRKLLDILSVYRSYEECLAAAGLCERAECIKEAASIVRTASVCDLESVFIDGFTTFSSAEQAMIRALTCRARRVVITLDFDEGHPEVFSHSARAFGFVSRLPNSSEVRLPKQDLSNGIGYVREHIFKIDIPPIEPDGTITLIEAVSPGPEASALASEIRRIVREEHLSFNDIAVIVRSVDEGALRFARVFTSYGVPLAWHMRPLRLSLVARTLLYVLQFVLHRRNPMLGLFSSEHMPSRMISQIVEDARHAFSKPGAVGMADAVNNLAERVLPMGDGLRLQGECAAWRAIQRITAEIVMHEAWLGEEICPEEFSNLLISGIRRGRYRVGKLDNDGISLLSPFEIEGRKFPVVFVASLRDGTFPLVRREASLLTDFERFTLNRWLVANPLETACERLARERYLFYAVIAGARERLYLSRAVSNAWGVDSPVARYVQDVEVLFSSTLPRVVWGVVGSAHKAEGRDSLLRAVVSGLRTAQEPSDQMIIATLYNQLINEGNLGPDVLEWLECDVTSIGSE